MSYHSVSHHIIECLEGLQETRGERLRERGAEHLEAQACLYIACVVLSLCWIAYLGMA